MPLSYITSRAMTRARAPLVVASLVAGAALAGTLAFELGPDTDLAPGRAARVIAAIPLAVIPPAPPPLALLSPEEAGVSARRLGDIESIVERGIAAGGFPGAAVVIGRRGGAVLEKGFGHLDWAGGSAAVDPDSSVYDLASLTKVVATTSAIMALYDDGAIALDDPVSRYVPGFTTGLKARVTIRDLLTHRSGLPAGTDLRPFAGNPAAARAAILATPLVRGCAPGKCYIYSDVGADVLGMVAAAAAGEPIDRFVAERVFAPLGMTQTTFHPGRAVARLAPTGAPPGRVHDGNAAALGGVAGHAGLFSTASDLAVFAQMLLDGGVYDGVRIFADSTVRLFTTRAAGTRALGWDTCDPSSASVCGRYLGRSAYGHLGFTGTSLWIDPSRRMFMILLTNRVDRPRVRRPALVIHDVRADVADAAVLAVRDADLGAPRARPAFRSDNTQRWERPIPRAPVRRVVRHARSRRVTHATARRATAGKVHRTHRRGR